MTPVVLILYHSSHGSTQALADAIAAGVSAAGAEPRLRVAPGSRATRDIEVNLEDLEQCHGLALGSPTRFGHMSHHLSAWFEQTSTHWLRGTMIDKPAAVFTSTASLHGGQESTLLSMAIPLLHHGMVLVGIPYSEPGLQQTTAGGTPYGASHHASAQAKAASDLSATERELAVALGTRLARFAQQYQQEQSQ